MEVLSCIEFAGHMVVLKIKITRYFTIWDSRFGENPRLILSRHQSFQR